MLITVQSRKEHDHSLHDIRQSNALPRPAITAHLRSVLTPISAPPAANQLAAMTSPPARWIIQPSALKAIAGVLSRTLSLPGADAADSLIHPANAMAIRTNDGSIVQQNAAQGLSLLPSIDILPSLMNKYPNVYQIAREKIKVAIWQKFGIDVDPDSIYHLRFSSAMNDPLSFSGWQHRPQDLIESRTLTSCVLHNFSADAQDNMDSVDMMSGLYNTDGQDVTDFNYANEIKILPSQLAELIWNMNFYYLFTTELDKFWIDPQVQEIRNIYTLIETLKNSRFILTSEHITLLLTGFGLKEAVSDDIKIFFLISTGILLPTC